MLILLYVQNERSYDRHFEKTERIYRLNVEYTIGDKVDTYANVPRPMAPTLKKEYPEVIEATRLVKFNRYSGNSVLLRDSETINSEIQEDLVFYADSTFFNIFEHAFLQGNPNTALRAKNTAVITEKVAHALYGDESPLGKVIEIDANQKFSITGVITNPSENTHLDFEVLLSWATFHTERDLNRWLGGHVFTYLLFEEYQDVDIFLAKWPDFYNRYMASTFDRIGGSCKLLMQPLEDIHLHSNLQWEVSENGSAVYVYVFLLIGVFILLIACINYMNMATARSATRAAEVGIRKTFGATKDMLRRQFLSESIILTAVSILIAIGFLYFILPSFNDFVGKSLSLNWITNVWIIPGLLFVGLVVSLIAGIYPAFFLSSFVPVEVLKDQTSASSRRSGLRKFLVVVQFAISIMIVSGTGIVYDQLNYARSKELGFDKDNILIITIRDNIQPSQIPAIKSQLLQNSNILAAATSYDLPGKDLNHTAMEIENASGEMQQQTFQFMQIDHDFINLMQMQLTAGRSFDRTMTTDATQAVMVNEAAVKKFNWQNPVGKKVRFVGSEDDLLVIGVVNDFHIGSLHHEIEPTVVLLSENLGGKMFLKLATNQIPETIRFLERQWSAYDPDFPMDYVFLDTNYYKLYETDQKLGQVFKYFALLAIFISCLGLIALSSFSTEQRKKEIGVRKVLGASSVKIVFLLIKDFLILVLAANFLAWPAAYYAMNKWLQDFAYRVDLDWLVFFAAGLTAFCIAILTVGLQTIKAALANPVKSLRYE